MYFFAALVVQISKKILGVDPELSDRLIFGPKMAYLLIMTQNVHSTEIKLFKKNH